MGVEVLRVLFHKLIAAFEPIAPDFHGLVSVAFDGTTDTMPDTISNVEKFHQPSSRSGKAAFPQRGGGQLPQLLDTLTEELQRQLGPDLWLLLLYGSHARGEAQPDSDVDLFVVLRRASEAVQEKVRQVAYEVMWEADFAYVISLYLIDVHHYETLDQRGSSFLRNVQREGKVLWKAAAYETYFPEVFGRSDGGKFVVTSAE